MWGLVLDGISQLESFVKRELGVVKSAVGC